MTVWCAGLDETAEQSHPNLHTIEINIYEKELCVKLVVYKDYIS
jgi:hypothetical protein